MLAKLKSLLDCVPPETAAPLPEAQLRLACAALLVEVAVIDDEFDDRELSRLHALLQQEYGLDEVELLALTEDARRERDAAASMYEFTRTLNDHCSPADKYRLARALWHIAYADGQLDKYEEYMIRKICELLHLPHSEFIRAKLEARAERDAAH